MKNKTIFIAFCVLALLFSAMFVSSAFLSCTSSPVQRESEYRLRSFNRAVDLFPSAESPRMNFELELFEAAGRESGFFNSFLYSGKSPDKYAGDLVRDFEEMYLENRGFAASQNPPPASFNWEYIERMDFTWLKEQGMLIGREKYIFTGGAHGMGSKKYYVIDLAGQKVLNLEDFFQDIHSDRLREIVFEGLRQYSAEKAGLVITEGTPLSYGLFLTDDPGISGNFYITSEGLWLNWEPVEIAPYFAGSIEIVLPWKLIRPLLKHDAMELLEKFGFYQFM